MDYSQKGSQEHKFNWNNNYNKRRETYFSFTFAHMNFFFLILSFLSPRSSLRIPTSSSVCYWSFYFFLFQSVERLRLSCQADLDLSSNFTNDKTFDLGYFCKESGPQFLIWNKDNNGRTSINGNCLYLPRLMLMFSMMSYNKLGNKLARIFIT